jgi:hypothetical protein
MYLPAEPLDFLPHIPLIKYFERPHGRRGVRFYAWSIECWWSSPQIALRPAYRI